MQEIGGFFEIELGERKNSFYSNLIAVNSGRNAIAYIVEASWYKTVYLPYYCCNCIEATLLKMNIECKYYHIDQKLKPIDVTVNEGEAILIINYYGQLNRSDIIDLKKKYKNVILDNTQNFFMKPIKEVDTVYSVRKYFGVSDGAYLQSKNVLSRSLKQDKSIGRVLPMIGRYEDSAQNYYALQQEKEKTLDNLELMKMSKFTKAILQSIDYKKVKRIRQSNFEYFHNVFKDINMFEVANERATFMYPLKINKAAEVRKRLIMQRIYVPVLWPVLNQEQGINQFEGSLKDGIVNLPIDQRYTKKQLEYIVKQVYNIIETIVI